MEVAVVVVILSATNKLLVAPLCNDLLEADEDNGASVNVSVVKTRWMVQRHAAAPPTGTILLGTDVGDLHNICGAPQ